jgi:hypothetical protein
MALTEEDKQWLSQEMGRLVTKEYLTGALSQLRQELYEENNRTYKDLSRRLSLAEEKLGFDA